MTEPAPDNAALLICTHNRADQLKRCLQSVLGAQEMDRSRVFVVANACTDNTAEVVTSFRCRLIEESKPGKSHALNAGIGRISAAFVLLLDDDVVVRPGWAKAMLEPFSDPEVGVVGGRVIPVLSTPAPEWLRGPYLDQAILRDHGPAADGVELGAAIVGANWGLRRSLLGDAPFHPRLGSVGSAPLGWDDWHLVRSLGTGVAYAPAAIAEHHFDPDRLRWRTIARMNFVNAMGAARSATILEYGGPSAARAAVDVVRCWRDLRRAQAANPRDRMTAASAGAELEALRRLGFASERLLGRVPPLADYVARHALQPRCDRRR